MVRSVTSLPLQSAVRRTGARRRRPGVVVLLLLGLGSFCCGCSGNGRPTAPVLYPVDDPSGSGPTVGTLPGTSSTGLSSTVAPSAVPPSTVAPSSSDGRTSDTTADTTADTTVAAEDEAAIGRLLEAYWSYPYDTVDGRDALPLDLLVDDLDDEFLSMTSRMAEIGLARRLEPGARFSVESLRLGERGGAGEDRVELVVCLDAEFTDYQIGGDAYEAPVEAPVRIAMTARRSDGVWRLDEPRPYVLRLLGRCAH